AEFLVDDFRGIEDRFEQRAAVVAARDRGEIGSHERSFIAETMAERTLGSMEGGPAIFERTVAERLSEVEIGELPLFDEVECGNGLPPHPNPLPQGGEG